MKARFISVGLLALWFALPAAAQPARGRAFLHAHPWIAEPEMRLKRGDDPAWARPDFNDADWERIRPPVIPSRVAIHWVRMRVTLPEPSPEEAIDAVAIAAVAAYEIYWDGRLLGRNGVVGPDRASEVPGPVDRIFPVPDSLATPGEHLVAFRVSNFRSGFATDAFQLNVGLTSQRAYYTARSRAAAFSVVAVGGGLVLGITMLLVGLLVNRRPAPVLFGLLCLSAATVQALQAWRGLFQYNYDWHNPRIIALITSVGVLGLCLVGFVAVFFGVRRPLWWVAGLGVTTVTITQLDFENANILLGILWWLPLVLAAVLAGWALVRGERRAIFVLGGLLVTCAILARGSVVFREQSFLPGMGATLLGCMIALTLQLRADRQAARQAQLTAARLEIELLKKNIQPHFVLNTLSTLIETIESEPKVAVTLIEALAAEFRLLAPMAGQRLVPMRQELQLCREHLRVMSLRRDVHYTLRTEGVDEAALIPPAVILTLIENGLTHARAHRGDVEFVLRSGSDGEVDRHVFISPRGAQRPANATAPAAGTAAATATEPIAAVDAATVEGTGSRYVKARLEESFSGRWTFNSGPTPHGWETTIELRPTRLERTPA